MASPGWMIPPPYPFPEKWPALFAGRRPHSGWLTPSTPISFGVAPVSVSGVQGFPAPSPPWGPMWPSAADDATIVVDVEEDDESDNDSDEDDDEDEEDDEEESSVGTDEYEYGYVLSDEWRERFARSLRIVTPPSTKNRPTRSQTYQSQKRDSTRQRRAQAQTSTAQEVPSQLQRLLAETREVARQRQTNRQSAVQQQRRVLVQAMSGEQPPAESQQQSSQSSLQQIHQLEAQLDARFALFCDSRSPAVWPHGCG
ncbi:hypothetical protein PINS_up010863 [Pythium insidiosum]|nr:hypothetical protein PINS_up010863 [Pythium insidiosum]